MPKKLIHPFLIATIGILTLACGVVNIQAQPGYYPPFVKAAQEGNFSEAEKLLKSGELINQTTIGNQTPLHLAAAEGQDDMVKWLLAHEANPLAQDQNGKTPSDFATSQGHAQTAQLILDYVQLVKDEEKAIAAGDTETLRNLLSQDGRGYTILHVAAQVGATQVIADEIKSGANVNVQTVNGITPLHKAVVSGKLEISQLLIDSGADVNIGDIYNNTPLYYAVSYENIDLIKLFLDAGADPSIPSVWGNETVLDFAKRKGNAEIIALLEKK
jgi:ankyrin repeat protein